MHLYKQSRQILTFVLFLLLFGEQEDSGFLSLNRAMSLDSVDIDLSKELTLPPPKPVSELQVEAARRGRLLAESGGNATPRWRFVPTRWEQEKWDRANKAATGGSEVMLRESKRERGDPKVLAAQSREQYFKLKQKLQILTLGIGGVGVFSAYVSYSPEIAARILAPDYGFMHLDLIPMLVGFFTYKVTTFIQAIEEALTIVENKQQV
ncbi:protein CONSERVED ONLY IN THE GREEN LINEAGE 160, chloroplastic-like isoform X2 [Magnolia sinica]|uniref:protein CONSERVED ONLY IN THE GREEN LINEAGE 160, chloroplastic-like isoform X2 n=1 Tax=Magnolia sinica TaxID=86752 RepID=UPI0026598888|nr:protein CONSERVED ONLY IN THE GREEN LINEAGE 160, chloroplastic-like isoform X2 [Magnolia sinica]